MKPELNDKFIINLYTNNNVPFKEIEDAYNKYLLDVRVFEDWVFLQALNDVVPKIKGEITKGKLKWRGVRIVEHKGVGRWIEQRGKRISNILPEQKPVLGTLADNKPFKLDFLEMINNSTPIKLK